VYRATHGVNLSKALKKRRYIENTLYLEKTEEMIKREAMRHKNNQEDFIEKI